MLHVDIKLRLDFNQISLKMQKRSFHVLLINKTSFSHILSGFYSARFLKTSEWVFGFGKEQLESTFDHQKVKQDLKHPFLSLFKHVIHKLANIYAVF